MGIVAAVVSLVVGAVGTVANISAQQDAAEQQKEIADQQAKDTLEQGRQEAADIRRRAALFKKTQEAQLAGSGVKLGTGTAADLLTETDRLAEMDVLKVLKNSSNEANYLRMGGKLAASKASSAALGSGLSFFGSALNTGYNLLGSKTATPSSSNIELRPQAQSKDYLGVGNVKNNYSFL